MNIISDEELRELKEGYEQLPEEMRNLVLQNVNVLRASEQMRKKSEKHKKEKVG